MDAGLVAAPLLALRGHKCAAAGVARAQVQRTPLVIVASHTAGAGEPYDYHGATIMLSEGMFKGLGIPYEIANESQSLDSLMFRCVQTARSQWTIFGLLIPPYLMSGGNA